MGTGTDWTDPCAPGSFSYSLKMFWAEKAQQSPVRNILGFTRSPKATSKIPRGRKRSSHGSVVLLVPRGLEKRPQRNRKGSEEWSSLPSQDALTESLVLRKLIYSSDSSSNAIEECLFVCRTPPTARLVHDTPSYYTARHTSCLANESGRIKATYVT